MRVPVVLCLSFFAIWLAIGCRSPLTPNVDRNKAPETWITAAPQDTVTLRDEDGRPIRPIIGTIAVRFHLYWAGSDEDGEVAGFYHAVVETLPVPPPGLSTLPPLPGPKPADYRFTTRTDSTFIFRVSEFSPDRQHAFFIYAVDNLGKADPTPARVIFNALDRFPPIPVIESAYGVGTTYRMLSNGMVFSREDSFPITDSLTLQNLGTPPRDTVALNARLEFHWRGEPRIAGTYVAGYRYKLDEPSFLSGDAAKRSISYAPGTIAPGTKVFTLRAVDEAGGVGETNRRFQMNYAPDTWFAGPDPSQYFRDPGSGDRFVNVGNWANPPPFPASLLSCDSITKLPAQRTPRKTFFEIYQNRVYVRSENDTVHMNSWVLLHSGGSDRDSPYLVQVSSNDPAIPDTTRCLDPALVLRRTGPNGSPIGFHQQHITFLAPNGPTSVASQSGLYPVYDAASVFRAPVIGGYQPMFQSGKIYAVVRAEDGNSERDKRITNARDLADRVDQGLGTPAENALRSLVLTFYVNKAPRLLFSAGNFVPQPSQTFFTRRLDFNLLADDADPYDPENRPSGTGGPSTTKVLRWRVQVRGQNAAGNPVLFPARADSVFSPQVTIDLGQSTIVSTQATVQVELCDCATCEVSPGSGRCVTYSIPINVPAPLGLKPAAPERSSGPGASLGRRSEVP